MIQPVINPDTSWKKAAPFSLNIDSVSAERVWGEIKTGLIEMLKVDGRPDIILIPELHLPVSRVQTIKKLSKKHGVVIISGIDFQSSSVNRNRIHNRGIICFPNEINTGQPSLKLTAMQFGKTYFTYMERSMFSKGIVGLGVCYPEPEQNMYIFKSSELGDFGIMICSDIFDIERMAIYQGQIHHLFVISLNKDLNTYFAMAESLTRLLYCNLIICNTGHYGGTLAVSPYNDANERTIYKYLGQRMFNSHVVNIPLMSLDKAQKFDFISDNKDGIKFKASPPGYLIRKD
ncbi:carbon-nitrogen hydrolase family protein [Chitinophaga dinghuensis]|nr:hypothetical protein [Chitinophaga dinghuensis]